MPFKIGNDSAMVGKIGSARVLFSIISQMIWCTIFVCFFESLLFSPTPRVCTPSVWYPSAPHHGPSSSRLLPFVLSVVGSNMWPARWDLRLRLVTAILLVVLARCALAAPLPLEEVRLPVFVRHAVILLCQFSRFTPRKTDVYQPDVFTAAESTIGRSDFSFCLYCTPFSEFLNLFHSRYSSFLICINLRGFCFCSILSLFLILLAGYKVFVYCFPFFLVRKQAVNYRQIDVEDCEAPLTFARISIYVA